MVEERGALRQQAFALEGVHREQYPNEEQEAGDLHALDGFRQRLLAMGVAALVLTGVGLRHVDPGLAFVEDLFRDPEHAECAQHAEVWRKMERGLEEGYAQDAEEADGEDDLRAVSLIRLVLDSVRDIAADVLHDEDERDCEAHETRQEKAQDEREGADLAGDPQHGGGHVTNG